MIKALSFLHLPQILAIEDIAYQYAWTESMFADSIRQRHLCFGLFKHEHLCAYCFAYIAVSECHILNLCVDPEYQRQGLAKELLNFVLELAQKQGALDTFLEVRPSNTAAIQLYRNLGFEKVGLRKGYYPGVDHREDAWVFRLPLNEPKG